VIFDVVRVRELFSYITLFMNTNCLFMNSSAPLPTQVLVAAKMLDAHHANANIYMHMHTLFSLLVYARSRNQPGSKAPQKAALPAPYFRRPDQDRPPAPHVRDIRCGTCSRTVQLHYTVHEHELSVHEQFVRSFMAVAAPWLVCS
jgi:hypothetical protein